MRRTVKIVSLVILGTVFLLWMTCSTELIARWRSTSKIVEIGPLGEEMMGLSFYQAANFEQLDTLFDTMRLEGYVYNISHATDDEATRSLLLASEKGCYQIELEELANNAKIYYTKFDETPKSYTGFGLDFCPLGLEDGSYELLLQVEENGTPVTRVPTGYVIEKVDGYSTLRYRPSDPAPEILEASGWANAGIDRSELSEDGTLELSGWAIVDGVGSTEETNVFLEVSSGGELVGTFSTTKENITYIADYFGNEGLYSAGFRACVPGVSADGLEVRVFVEHQGTFYKCSYHFEPDAGLEGMVSVSDLTGTPVEDEWAQTQAVEMEDVQEALGWANAGLSRFELSEDGTLRLAGWGIVDGVGSAEETEVYVQLCDGTGSLGTYRTKKEPAAYIAEYFDNDGYQMSGFRVSIPEVGTKEVGIRVFVGYHGGIYRCAYHFEYDEGSGGPISVSDLE